MVGKVLVIGYRKPLCRVLERKGIPYVLWTKKLPSSALQAAHVVLAEVDPGVRSTRLVSSLLTPLGPFSHVIAGTESAVVTASIARRTLGARISDHSRVRACHDKLKMKDWLSKARVPLVKYLKADGSISADELLAQLGVPVVVKERASSGGRGLIVARTCAEVKKALAKRKLAESLIDAPEMSVESFIDNGKVLFTNFTSYVEKAHSNLVAHSLSEPLREQVLNLNRQVLETLSLQWGMTHLELYLTPEGPVFGEIAIRPPGGYIMELLKLSYGFNAWEAYVAVELGQPFTFPQQRPQVAGSYVFHPGAGTIKAIRGVKEARRIPGLVKLRIKAKEGQVLPPRSGVGEDVGYALFKATDEQQVLAALSRLKSTVQFVFK